MEELKPCPFCGGEAGLEYYTSPFDERAGVTDRYTVFCKTCGANIYHSVENARFRSDTCKQELEDCKRKTIEAWNRRATDESRN